MSGAMIYNAGTGAMWGAAGVKTGKLCVEQDQIGGEAWLAPTNPRVDCLSLLVRAGLEK